MELRDCGVVDGTRDEYEFNVVLIVTCRLLSVGIVECG